MKTWQWFIFFVFLPIRNCLSIRSAYEDADSMEQNKTGKRPWMEFGISWPTEILQKITEDGQHKDQEHSGEKKKNFTTDNVISRNQQRNMNIGIPNLSDTCFRVYNESIVINAQPYERRSSMQLDECKQRCMQSQTGIYSCRSFVYDIAKKICDFLTHKGDQAPAKLIKYYEHLYLEPTFNDECVLKYARKSKKITAADRMLNSTVLLNVLTVKDTKEEICEDGEVFKYLKTQGFKLDSSKRINLKTHNLDACIDTCNKNIDDKGRTFECRSFNYNKDGCSMFDELASPRGIKQLKRNSNFNYFEKICLKNDLMSNECQIINRFPQMILAGFAEAVITARSLMECFENCLKSRHLLAMNCTSGIYFYDELEQNCILNSENGQTQKDVFVEETMDIVDYFDLTCL